MAKLQIITVKESIAELTKLILDNGAFHKAKDLEIPENIGLLFIPPYSPELNPAEKMWRHFKDEIATEVFKSLDDLSDRITGLIKNLKETTIKSITSYKYYLENFYSNF